MKRLDKVLLVAALFSATAVPARTADALRYYPARAERMGIEGVASISCFVTIEGALRNCVVKSEEPAGAGFGEAALNMATLFKMRPATRDGKPVESVMPITIPIRFTLPVDGKAAAHRLAKKFDDPRVKSWLERTIISGRQSIRVCWGLLAQDGFPGVLRFDADAIVPDYSKELSAINQAHQHLQTVCAREDAAWREGALRDLRSTGLPEDQQKLVAGEFEAGMGRFRTELASRRLTALDQARELLEFLASSGARWQGSTKEFSYPSIDVAAQGNKLMAQAAASRKALAETEQSAP
jgi:TonB family protein